MYEAILYPHSCTRVWEKTHRSHCCSTRKKFFHSLQPLFFAPQPCSWKIFSFCSREKNMRNFRAFSGPFARIVKNRVGNLEKTENNCFFFCVHCACERRFANFCANFKRAKIMAKHCSNNLLRSTDRNNVARFFYGNLLRGTPLIYWGYLLAHVRFCSHGGFSESVFFLLYSVKSFIFKALEFNPILRKKKLNNYLLLYQLYV